MNTHPNDLPMPPIEQLVAMAWIAARSVSAAFAKLGKSWMKPRWMTPSADEAPRLRTSRSARSPSVTSAPAVFTTNADASERARPTT